MEPANVLDTVVEVPPPYLFQEDSGTWNAKVAFHTNGLKYKVILGQVDMSDQSCPKLEALGLSFVACDLNWLVNDVCRHWETLTLRQVYGFMVEASRKYGVKYPAEWDVGEPSKPEPPPEPKPPVVDKFALQAPMRMEVADRLTSWWLSHKGATVTEDVVMKPYGQCILLILRLGSFEQEVSIAHIEETKEHTTYCHRSHIERLYGIHCLKEQEKR